MVNNIKKFRLATGLTQEQLGQKIGVDGSTIANWECGRRVPSIPNAIKLAVVFDTSLDAIFAKDHNAKAGVYHV